MNRKGLYKDMEKFRNTRNAQKRRYYGKTSNAKNSRKPWTEDEIDLIIEHNKTDTELAGILGRSVRAIQAKRPNVKKDLNI